MNLDSEIIQQLELSAKGFKQVYPVLRDQRTGEILAGRHRQKAGWTNIQDVDVDKYASHWDVPREVAVEKIRASLNIQRKVSVEETKQSLSVAGRAFLKAGVQKGELVKKLKEHFPYYSEGYIRNLLPKDLKEENKVEAGKSGREKQLESGSSGKTEQSSAHTHVGTESQPPTMGAPKPQPESDERRFTPTEDRSVESFNIEEKQAQEERPALTAEQIRRAIDNLRKESKKLATELLVAGEPYQKIIQALPSGVLCPFCGKELGS